MTVALIERPADILDVKLVSLRAEINNLLGDRCKIEILGGDVKVSPLAMTLHDKIVNQLHLAFARALNEDDFDLTQRVEFVVDAWNSPQPDLAVMSAELRSTTLTATEYHVKDALLVVEVTSPSNAENDRKWGFKYKAYAKGMVPAYLLVDPHAKHGPSLSLFTQPTGTRYEYETSIPFGKTLILPEPFDTVEFDSGRFPVPAA